MATKNTRSVITVSLQGTGGIRCKYSLQVTNETPFHVRLVLHSGLSQETQETTFIFSKHMRVMMIS